MSAGTEPKKDSPRSRLFNHQRALINSLWEPMEGESRIFEILDVDGDVSTSEDWLVSCKSISPGHKEFEWKKV